MIKLKNIILRIHLTALIILVINFIIDAVFEISLISNLRLGIKILFYISACILFFYYIKPFKKLTFYFSIFIFSPVLIFISWLIDGVFGAILGSIFLFFFVPNDTRFENDQIQINKEFGGFLGSCCKYKVIEKTGFIFEKNIGEFQFEDNLYLRKEDVQVQKDTLKLHLILKNYHHQKDDHYVVTDSIIYIELKH